MSVILSKWIVDLKEQNSIYIIKEIQTPLVPIIGASVQDTVWRHPQIPTHITCDFGAGCYYLNFSTEKVSSTEELNHMVQHYYSHNWREGLERLFE